MATIKIYDCGCVPSRPKDPSCNSYGTRWRSYISILKDNSVDKIILKCRDCGRIRHFALKGVNPVLIQYGEKDNDRESKK